jgi:predicted XRE-type DNA-binding protein
MPGNDPIPSLKLELSRIVVARLDGWTQENAAAIAKLDQPRISDLRRQRLERFSLTRLIRIACRLRGTVSIHVTWPADPL